MCAVLGPNGSDDHYQVIDFILREHRLPPALMFAQSFHPPLYHLLGAPFAAIGGPRAVEVLSLMLSIANGVLLVRLVREHYDGRPRLHATLLIALLPPLVLFSLVVSNDSLAMLTGTLCILAALRFVRAPSARAAALCGLAAGIGLLTKGTLLAHAAVLLFVVARRKNMQWIAVFAAIAIALGSYKFIENKREYGRFIVHNMDLQPDWMVAQQPTITSPWSWVDVNLAKLWREPYSGTNPHSAPLLLYATFWHSYDTVSNFREVPRVAPIVGKLTYVFAVVPTILILLGLRKRPLLATFLAVNVAIVIAAGARYDAWSCFQSRLFFPSFAAIALAYAAGIDEVPKRWKLPVEAVCGAVYALFVAAYAIDISHIVVTHLQ